MTSPAGAPRLRTQNLQCSAGNRVLFEGLDLELFDGQCLLLLGPNGSGKTTLLRALAGLTRPTQGTIDWLVDYSASPQLGEPMRAAQRLYQGHNSGWKLELSARENLTLQTRLDEINADQAAVDQADIDHPAIDKVRINAALQRAGIAEQAQLAFGRLSAGQRRRLTLARLMLDQRPIWLLDEPATALDEHGLRLLGELLDQKLANHGLIVTATHQDLRLKQSAIRLELASFERARR